MRVRRLIRSSLGTRKTIVSDCISAAHGTLRSSKDGVGLYDLLQRLAQQQGQQST